MTRSVTVRAPGKVNLQLSVGPVQEDGYHPLATVFQAVDLYETVTATVRKDEQITVDVAAARGAAVDIGAVPLDGSNIAVRAAQALRDAFGVTDGIAVEIVKGVPVAGGMAGGSADAAAALLACAEAWDLGVGRSQLDEIAAELGADVPFILHGHTAVGLGRGDQITPAMTRGQFHWVIATQPHGLSTAEVYGEYDRMIESGERSAVVPEISEDIMVALRAGDAELLGDVLVNDLQPAALSLAPHLRSVMEQALEAEALGAMVSGSGPTVAALARSRQHALAIAAHLTVSGTADAVVTASGPAPGAVVVG
ncbi:4-(cytidine 5'-diphospho)-2-C-methyl-D-erythritol kinase [Demequina activiva]|uniref:4-diphosphocytidyl-2-C-methyl-D-erythritol kinase n=1 Tax=Demequina activiva TaxID=1582364 RepID=A0A919Q108_9MICO|nr:4-(cytidine 5'-diphospho)-2-C-methyl-D-erythritol kinase [Demequina activiva]GIG53669.1 4-diphosphocytidyl-2-C-methyl-D-erythritol kinase [Demequina activiva]